MQQPIKPPGWWPILTQKFPPEIFSEIFSFLTSEACVLVPCSQAHPIFAKIVELTLYAHVIVHNRDSDADNEDEHYFKFKLYQFSTLLSDNPRILNYLRSLCVELTQLYSRWWGYERDNCYFAGIEVGTYPTHFRSTRRMAMLPWSLSYRMSHWLHWHIFHEGNLPGRNLQHSLAVSLAVHVRAWPASNFAVTTSSVKSVALQQQWALVRLASEMRTRTWFWSLLVTHN